MFIALFLHQIICVCDSLSKQYMNVGHVLWTRLEKISLVLIISLNKIYPIVISCKIYMH